MALLSDRNTRHDGVYRHRKEFVLQTPRAVSITFRQTLTNVQNGINRYRTPWADRAYCDQFKQHTMNTKTALQAARNVMTGKHLTLADVTRSTLKAAAVANGRTMEQASKASTMRLALWASVGKSAI